MSNLLQAETYKILRNKSFWTILIISSTLALLLHFLVIIEWWMLSGTPFDEVGLSELNALSMFMETIYFNLFIGPLAAFFISTEFGTGGTIKNQIISGRKRSGIYLAKYIVYTFASVIIAVLIPLITAVLANVILGNAGIFDMNGIIYLVRIFGLYILQFAGFTAIILLLAVITEDSGKTIIFSILFTIVMFVVGQFATSGFIAVMYDHSIFQQFNMVMEPDMTSSGMITALAVGIITIIVMLAIGMFVFNRKEIK